MIAEELKQSIIELYQKVKIRKNSKQVIIDKSFLEKEKISLFPISPLVLIQYIKTHLNLLIDIKVNEKISQLEKAPIEYISYYGTEIPANDYEKLLRRYEGDIRNYIRIVNVLKIHIDELNEKQELLQQQIEQLQKESINFIPTDKSLEYKKKIEELTTLVKSYEKHNLKIPLLEKKIKIQKIELDKLDSYYKKQIKSFAKRLENYEKGIYLNRNNSMMKKIKVIKSNNRNSISNNKRKNNKTNSISPPKENKTLSYCRYEEPKIEKDKNLKQIEKASSIKTIFLYSKNIEINNKKNDEEINKNLNTNNNNINGGNSFKKPQNNNDIFSPKNGDKKIMINYYDSIETDIVDNHKIHKTINISGTTITDFHKKSSIKSNSNIKKVLYTKKSKEKDNNKNAIIKKFKSRSNSKKEIKKMKSNKSFLKIPKNIPDHINTSKYTCIKSKNNDNFSLCIKGKNNENFNRHNSLKQLIDGKSRLKINSNKENEQFNKTFSKIPNISNISTNTRSSTNNDNKTQKREIKNYLLKKLNNINNVPLNYGRTPIPIKKTTSKAQSFIK